MQWILILVGVYVMAWIVADKSPKAQADAKAWADRLGKQLLLVALLLVAIIVAIEWLAT